MLRRQFIQAVTLSGACAIAARESLADTSSHVNLVLTVRGFTCPTCAVGLDTLLNKEKGIVSSHSTYPEGKVTVIFDSQLSSEEKIRAFIAGMGFTVTGSHTG